VAHSARTVEFRLLRASSTKGPSEPRSVAGPDVAGRRSRSIAASTPGQPFGARDRGRPALPSIIKTHWAAATASSWRSPPNGRVWGRSYSAANSLHASGGRAAQGLPCSFVVRARGTPSRSFQTDSIAADHDRAPLETTPRAAGRHLRPADNLSRFGFPVRAADERRLATQRLDRLPNRCSRSRS